MNKKTKIIALSLFGGTLLTTSAIATSVALVSCNNNDNNDNYYNDINTFYKPSTDTKNLISENSFTNIKSNANKWIKFCNNGFKSKDFLDKVKNPSFKFKDGNVNPNKLELNGDVLKLSYSINLIYKIPILDSNNLFIPENMNIKDINTYIEEHVFLTYIDLVGHKISIYDDPSYVINGEKYIVKSNLKNTTQFDLNEFKLYLSYYEQDFNFLNIPYYSITTGDLTKDKVDKLCLALYKLINIVPPTMPTEWKSYLHGWDCISINLNPIPGVEKSINFEYYISDTISFDEDIKKAKICYYFSYNTNQQNWDLEYTFDDYSINDPSHSTSKPQIISGITDAQLTNFFKQILDNSTIMDINQIKK